jgi:hypothetical protein
MSHLPSPVGASVDTLSRRVRATLVNPPYRQYASLYDYLTRTTRLDRAEIELRVFTAPPSWMGIEPGQLNRMDAAVTGGEASDWFAGIVDRVVAVGPEIQLECKTQLPTVPWKLVPDDGSDPRDRGLRLPYPLGAGAVVRCVNLAVGEVSTLGRRLSIDDTYIQLDDASAFPDFGTGMVGAESIAWVSKDSNGLVGDTVANTRAQNGTLQANHIFGTGVVEIQDIVLGVASESIASVTGLFILSPSTSTTVEVPKLIYSVNTNDELTPPGDTGEPITSITMTGSQVIGLLNGLYADATVTQQPAFATLDPPLQELSVLVAGPGASNALFDQGDGAVGNWTFENDEWASGTPPNWTYQKVSVLTQGLRIQFPAFGTGVGTPPNVPEPFHTLKSIRFDFTMDVQAITSPITFGIQAFNIEGKLQGAVDGELVGALEVSATGPATATGVSYLAVDGTLLSALDDVYVELIKSDIAGGNPTADIDFTDVSSTYVWADDTTVDNADAFPPTGAEVAFFPGVEGDWSGTSNPVQNYNPSLDVKHWRSEYDVDPLSGIQADSPIISARLKFTTTLTNVVGNDPNNTFYQFRTGWDNFLATVPSAVQNTHGTVNGQQTQTVALDVKPGAKSSDLIGASMNIYTFAAGPVGETFTFNDWHIELTYRIADVSIGLIPQVQDSQIEAAAGGTGLQFFAICDGPEIPDNEGPGTTGELMSHPADVIFHWLRRVGGIPLLDIDATSFGDAETNLGTGYVWGFDARNLGATWGECLLQMGYEARANVANLIGSGWSMITAQATFDFPAAAATVDSYGDLITIGKDDAELKSRLTVYYAHDPRFESSDNRSFQQVQTTDPTDPAVIAREAEFGRNDAEPYFLFCSTALGLTGVEDWRGYFEQELGRFARLFSCRVDHWQAYPLELGDVITFVGGGGESVKARVIEVTRSERQGFLLRFAEVL